MFLRRILQQLFCQSAVLRQRSGKENRPNISAHTSDVARLLRCINGRYPTAYHLRGNFLPERNGAIFPDQPLAREQKSAREPAETLNVRSFPKGLRKRRRIGINKNGLGLCFGQNAQQPLIAIKTGRNNQNTSVRRQCRGANAIQNITNSDLLGFALMKFQSDLSAVPRRLTGMPRHDFDGGRPYVDAVERKPPLLFWLYAAIFEATGKFNPAGLHVVALGWTLATMAGLYVIGRQLFDRGTGLVAALLYSVYQPWGTFKN